jgi:hypothetical protein
VNALEQRRPLKLQEDERLAEPIGRVSNRMIAIGVTDATLISQAAAVARSDEP